MEEQKATSKGPVEEEAIEKPTIDKNSEEISSSSAGGCDQSSVALETEGGGGGGSEGTAALSVSNGGTAGGEGTGARNTARKRTKQKVEETKRLCQDETKVVKDSAPNDRIVRKKMRRSTGSRVIIPNRCDCLIDACPGCHFYPCAGCGGHFCGQVCRRGRRWEFEELEIQGPNSLEKRTLPTYKDAVADE